MNTPYNKDVFGMLATALSKVGLRVGAYVCPSLWNSDFYWAPNALNSLGPVCAPNYSPPDQPDLWSKYVAQLHALVSELTTQYSPDLFWFDCFNTPPGMDTRIEALLSAIRTANPEAVVLTRNGVFSDYTETDDQSESLAEKLVGQSQMPAGLRFEVPAVLQSSRQWAYDPSSGQKPPELIISNLMLLASKGGNYLVNVALDPTGETK